MHWLYDLTVNRSKRVVTVVQQLIFSGNHNSSICKDYQTQQLISQKYYDSLLQEIPFNTYIRELDIKKRIERALVTYPDPNARRARVDQIALQLQWAASLRFSEGNVHHILALQFQKFFNPYNCRSMSRYTNAITRTLAFQKLCKPKENLIFSSTSKFESLTWQADCPSSLIFQGCNLSCLVEHANSAP